MRLLRPALCHNIFFFFPSTPNRTHHSLVVVKSDRCSLPPFARPAGVPSPPLSSPLLRGLLSPLPVPLLKEKAVVVAVTKCEVLTEPDPSQCLSKTRLLSPFLFIFFPARRCRLEHVGGGGCGDRPAAVLGHDGGRCQGGLRPLPGSHDRYAWGRLKEEGFRCAVCAVTGCAVRAPDLLSGPQLPQGIRPSTPATTSPRSSSTPTARPLRRRRRLTLRPASFSDACLASSASASTSSPSPFPCWA